jgi:hypothetical protein
MTNPNGRILWEGASRINGAPVVVIATGFRDVSSNGKTGDMVQTYIMRSDIPPLDALASGADSAVCGGCPFRKALRGGCYVNVGHAPRGIWECYRNGAGYDYLTDTAPLAGRRIRFGSYGDPAAAPLGMWLSLAAAASGHTGYTHQWRARRFEGFRAVCQASADSPEDVTTAAARGWGTFRVSPPGDRETLPGEFYCPSPAVSCADCRACDGASGARVLIEAHGSGAGKVVAP